MGKANSTRLNRLIDKRTLHPENPQPVDTNTTRRIHRIGKSIKTRRNNQISKPSRQSTVYKQDDSTGYKSSCQPAWKANIQTKSGQPPNGENTWTVFSLNHKRRIDYKERKPRGLDHALRRRLVRRREFQIPERVAALVILYGTPVMWSSRRQDVVSMSITEAQYIACSETAKDYQ